MKKFLLITSCFLSLSPMAYAMDTGSSVAQEEQGDGRLTVKKTLEIPYEKKIFLPNGAGALPFPVNLVEFTQKNVDMGFSFDERGHVGSCLEFPAGFPNDLHSRIFTAFNDFEPFPEEHNPDGFGCLSGSVTSGRETIGSYTEQLISPWEGIERTLLVLKAQAYRELLALRDGIPASVTVLPRGGATAEPLATVDEESASSGDESSVLGDEGEDQLSVVAISLSPLEPIEVLEKVAQTKRPALSDLRSWLKRMGAIVTTKKHPRNRRKIAQISVAVGNHRTTFSSKTDKAALKRHVTKFLEQVGGPRE
ncbi:MAG: hypothetical protein HYX35_03485 [Proteobacteria bacterium]|nr:hypothetical protein [Pseudomonadota bacterium]